MTKQSEPVVGIEGRIYHHSLFFALEELRMRIRDFQESLGLNHEDFSSNEEDRMLAFIIGNLTEMNLSDLLVTDAIEVVRYGANLQHGNDS